MKENIKLIEAEKNCLLLSLLPESLGGVVGVVCWL